MTNEHNPIAQLVTKIQRKWAEEITPFPDYKIIRWLIKAEESKLYEGFVHLESTQHGKLPEIFVALLNPFQSPHTYSRDLCKTWLETYDKDQKIFESLHSNGQPFYWDADYFRKKINSADVHPDLILLELLATFYAALQMPRRKLTVALMPCSVDNIKGYEQWLKNMMKAGLPAQVQFCIFDYVDERFFDDVFTTFDTQIAKTVFLELDLKGATNKLMQAGDPNSPEVQLRNYMVEMSDALSKRDLQKLKRTGQSCIDTMTRSGKKLLMATAYIMYAGMLFNFKEYSEIEILLHKGLKIAQYGESAGDRSCRSLIPQYHGYIATNYQLSKKYLLAIEWFCSQAQLSIAYSLHVPAIAAYRQAAILSQKNEPTRYKEILQKAFLAGENLNKEELAFSDYNFLGLEYHSLLSQNNEWDMCTRIDTKMNDVFGKNWKEETNEKLTSAKRKPTGVV